MATILIISAVFPPEPVVSAKLSHDISCALSERNSVTVISPNPSRPFGFQFSSKGIPSSFKHILSTSFVHPESGLIGRFRESYSFGIYCYKYISDNFQNIDCIYANTWPLLAQYLAVKAASKFEIPIIIHVQDIYPESLSKKIPFAASFINSILLPLDKFIMRKAKKVIAISQKMKDYLVKSRKLDSNKIPVIPNWQDEESFLNCHNQSDNTSGKLFTFMYLGNIGPVAGVDLLLKAFSKTHLKNARLVIAGSGSMKESLVTQAEDYSDCIIEFWTVPEGKVAEIQSLSDVLMLPVKKGNASTSIPSKLPAYMFSGRPIIGCVDEDSDTASVINSAKCGYVTEPENVELLSLKMSEFYKMEKSKLFEMGKRGRDFALLNFSKEINLKKLVSIVENLLTKN